jgi:hypothetical protein
MGTHSIHGPRRVRRAARLGIGGATALLTIGAFAAFAVGSAHASTTDDEGSVVPVFVVQPTNTQVNTAVTPTVVVNVDEPGGGPLDTGYNGPVILTYAVNPNGAPLPTGNQVNAVNGVASFPALTFSAKGFGFELTATVPAVPDEPGVRDNNSLSDGGGTSAPSAPFDIVDQSVNCAQVTGTCQTNTVSSGGTSGFATATNNQGILDATADEFPLLSCTKAGGVLTFSSTAGMTVTVTLIDVPADLIGHPLKDFNACWGAPQTFLTKSGVQAQFNQANGDFEGLLPNCSSEPAPCVLSRSKDHQGDVTLMVLAPAGDPHITY